MDKSDNTELPFGGKRHDNDPGGSYTGTPSGPDLDLEPEQDADDL